MSERRRTSRFVIPEFTEATFRIMQDVCVEQSVGRRIVLVTAAPLRSGESMLLELPRAQGLRSVVPVQVVDCTSTSVGDARRYRSVLFSENPPDALPERGAPGKLFKTPPLALPALGILVRRVSVRIRDVSVSGCLLESVDVLDEGMVGQLEISVGREPHSEPLRVCRSSRNVGSPWPWRAGAHFLALNAPAPASVRNVAARFEIIDELMSRVAVRR